MLIQEELVEMEGVKLLKAGSGVAARCAEREECERTNAGTGSGPRPVSQYTGKQSVSSS